VYPLSKDRSFTASPKTPNVSIKFLKLRKIKIVMVTDADFEYTIRTSSALKILDDFDYIITAEDVRSPNQMPKFSLKHYFWQTTQKRNFLLGILTKWT